MIESEAPTVELLSHQYDYVFSPARYLLNSGGVGSGKTFAFVHRTLNILSEHPGFHIVTGSDLPTIKHTVLRDWLDIVPAHYIQTYNKTDHLFTMTNGAKVLFRAFDDPQKLRSYQATSIGMIEMTNLAEDLFKMARTRIREQEVGFIYGDTNPGNLEHWVYKTFIEDGGALQNSDVIFSRSVENPHLPKEYVDDLETLRTTNPEYYRRMVDGQWGALEGLIYSLPPEQRIDQMPEVFHEVIAGLDFGFNHPTGLSVLGRIEDKWHIIDELYEYKLTSAEIIDRARQFCDRYPISRIYCDSARPEIIADLARANLPAVSALKGASSVFDGIMYVKGIIGAGNLVVSNACRYHQREFDSYIWDQRGGVKEAPVKQNDHLLDALRYALFTHRRQAPKKATPIEWT